MTRSYEVAKTLVAKEHDCDDMFAEIYNELKRLKGITEKPSTSKTFYPFGTDVDFYYKWIKATSVVEWWIAGSRVARWNV